MEIFLSVLAVAAVLFVLYALYMYKGWVYFPKFPEDSSVPPVLVAHAGGGIEGATYTNSLEALDLNYSLGHRVIEVDFCWTSDGKLVVMHDWKAQWLDDFVDATGIPTYDEYMAAERKDGRTQMDLDDFFAWMDAHPEVYIITDVKADYVNAMRTIRDARPDFLPRYMPQIYTFEQYDPVRELGYGNVIITLYQMLYLSPSERAATLRFAARKNVFAVTMQGTFAANMSLAPKLLAAGERVFAHTVNDPNAARRLGRVGVTGFYTDHIVPGGGYLSGDAIAAELGLEP